VKGGVERALFDLQDVVGELLKTARNGVPVSWTPAQGFQDEYIQCPLQQIY
jgi:hypothetical protein